ncbi:MAG: FliM/FliN family flagellar motor switch protein, partial [Betaproteobacteria bacterium]|nr:FliM/FliN family flagellar motor switch protein [Betaproteobacteria bacterium]
EIVVTTSFIVEIGEAGGEMFICTPYASLEPIRDLLYTSLQGDTQEPDHRWLNMLTKQVQVAEIELTAELAQARMTVGELLKISPGDFIELSLEKDIAVKVDGVPLFDAKYGLVGGHYAIKVNQFLNSPNEAGVAGDRHAK